MVTYQSMEILCWCSHIDVFRLWHQYVYTFEWFCVGLNKFTTNGVNMAMTHTKIKEKKRKKSTKPTYSACGLDRRLVWHTWR